MALERTLGISRDLHPQTRLYERIESISASVQQARRQSPPPVILPTFLNGWSTVEAGTGYYLFDGHVQLIGRVQGGTVALGSPIFVLPVGYRPSYPWVHAIVNASSAPGYVRVNGSNGNVDFYSGSNTFVDLSQISFRVV